MLRLVKVFLIISLVTIASVSAADKSKIKASVDKTKISTGEAFNYTLQIEGFFLKPKLILPEFENLRVISQNKSQTYSLERGKTKVVMRLEYALFATKPGTITLKPVVLDDGEKKYSTKTIKIKVSGKTLPKEDKITPYLEQGINI